MIPCFNITILILSSNLGLSVSKCFFPLGFALVQAIHQVSVNSEAKYGRVLKCTISRRSGTRKYGKEERKWDRNITNGKEKKNMIGR